MARQALLTDGLTAGRRVECAARRVKCPSKRAQRGPLGGVIVGEWPTIEIHDSPLHFGRVTLISCPPNVSLVKRALAKCPRPWLLSGLGIDERTLRDLWHFVRVMRPGARLGMIGASEEKRRFLRWMRQGCSLYLTTDTERAALEEALGIATYSDVGVFAREFIASPLRGPVVRLTLRQEQVLALLVDGLLNEEIADTLSVTVATIEFHMAQILLRLGARNRAQAAAIATAIGLA